jgi:hypothetical protein
MREVFVQKKFHEEAPNSFFSRSAANAKQARISSRVSFRKISQDFILAHPSGQVLQHIVNGDPQTPDAGLPATFAGLNSDDIPIVHSEAILRYASRSINKFNDSSGPAAWNRKQELILGYGPPILGENAGQTFDYGCIPHSSCIAADTAFWHSSLQTMTSKSLPSFLASESGITPQATTLRPEASLNSTAFPMFLR